ncbi:MAG: radical SAM protein [Proteobacteria bacterium]|nr:radical SAM protein [Pseudomonadota bacterium]
MDCKWTFLSADVELTNLCSENCAMCPRDHLQRPQGIMSQNVFSKVLEVLVGFDSRITFSGFGNPTLHPLWHSCVKQARAAGLPAGLVLHPSTLTSEVLQLLVRHPPSHLEISFPSIDPALFSRLCPRSDYTEAVRRVVELRRLNITPMVCVGLQTDGSLKSAGHYRSFWKAYGVRTRFFPCHSRGGNLQDRSWVRATPSQSQSCGLLAIHAFVAWNGDLLACCHDLTGETRIGNLCTDEPMLLAQQKSSFAEAGPPWALCQACDEFRKNWPLPEGACPRDPAERGRQLAKKVNKK